VVVDEVGAGADEDLWPALEARAVLGRHQRKLGSRSLGCSSQLPSWGPFTNVLSYTKRLVYVKRQSWPSWRNLTSIPSVWYILAIMAKMVKRHKGPAAVALGRKGGKARIAKLSKEERSHLARLAVQTRWARAKAAKNAPPEAR
jgi:hypothetical protein